MMSTLGVALNKPVGSLQDIFQKVHTVDIVYL